MHLSTTLELGPILEETLRTAAAIEGTELGLLSLCDPQSNGSCVKASLGFSEEELQAIENVPAGGISGTCYRERRRVVVEDVEQEPLSVPELEAARRSGFRAIHATPLITRAGESVGVLATHFRQPHRPTDREMHLIELCARQAVDFIENARLYRELWEADRRKDEFLATLATSCEIHSPRSAILCTS